MMRGTALGLVTIVATAGTLSAQSVMMNPSAWYVNNQIYSMRVFSSAMSNLRVTGTRADGGSTRRGPAAPREVVIPTQYRESPSSTIPAMLSQNSAGLGRSREDVQSLFATHIARYKTTMERNRFPSNDLASAYMYFIVNNYHIYHDLLEVPYAKDPRARAAGDMFDRITAMGKKRQLQVTPSQYLAIVDQFRTQLGASTEIRSMTDAQKQEATELLAVMFGVNYEAYMQGIDAEDTAQLQRGRDMAKQGLERLLGIPIAQIRITNTGVQRGQ